MTEPLPAGPDERAGREQAARTLGLVPSLDGLRGVAIIFICVYHLDPFIHSWTKLVPGLSIGVDIFFVLSGFLITAILLREHDMSGRIRLLPFYEGRVLRLFPALFAMVAVEFVWSLFLHYPMGYELKAVASAVTYVSNWGFAPWHVGLLQEAKYPVGMGQLWSLAVEEQFYLFWPLVLIALLAVGGRLRLVPIGAVVVAIVVVSVRRAEVFLGMSSAEFLSGGWSVLYSRTDYRVDDLLWGALLAMLWVRGWFPHRRALISVGGWLGAAALIAVALKGLIGDGWMYVWGMPVVAVGAAAVVLACVESGWAPRRLLEARWLCAVGVVSYGIYVWHLLAYAMVTRVGGTWPAGFQLAAALGLTAVMVLASWYLVEKPFLRIKDRLRHRQGSPPSTRAASSTAPDPPTDEVDPEVARLFDPPGIADA